MTKSKYEAAYYQATRGGTWPDGTAFAPGDVVPAARIPGADKHRLIARGVFVPTEAPRRAPPKEADHAPA